MSCNIVYVGLNSQSSLLIADGLLHVSQPPEQAPIFQRMPTTVQEFDTEHGDSARELDYKMHVDQNVCVMTLVSFATAVDHDFHAGGSVEGMGDRGRT